MFGYFESTLFGIVFKGKKRDTEPEFACHLISASLKNPTKFRVAVPTMNWYGNLPLHILDHAPLETHLSFTCLRPGEIDPHPETKPARRGLGPLLAMSK